MQPVEPVARNSHGGFCEGGKAQAASTARPVPTHHSVNQKWLVRFLEHRINDPRILRLIQKWLKAGVLEDGEVKVSETGTGQGSVISPLLANVYLHYTFDLWAERWRRREAKGDMIFVRYADDIVLGFQYEDDARRFLNAMRERLRGFSLGLHPDKTRLITFGRFAAAERIMRRLGKPETFNFLGFTFICGKSRQGKFLLLRKSRGDRIQAKLKQVKEELRERRHQPIPEQGKWLRQVVGGFFAYHSAYERPCTGHVPSPCNGSVATFASATQSERPNYMGAHGQARLAQAYLPQPRILHPWPWDRFAVKHPRWEPSA